MTAFGLPRAGRGCSNLAATKGTAPRIAISFTATQAAWIKVQAQRRKCSISAVIRDAVRAAIAKEGV